MAKVVLTRDRILKSRFFLHELLAQIEWFYELPLRIALLGLFVCADRKGRFCWEPQKLQRYVFPCGNVNFEELLNILAAHAFIIKYQHQDRYYGCIPAWLSFQTINHREAQSILPALEESLQIPPMDLEQFLSTRAKISELNDSEATVHSELSLDAEQHTASDREALSTAISLLEAPSVKTPEVLALSLHCPGNADVDPADFSALEPFKSEKKEIQNTGSRFSEPLVMTDIFSVSHPLLYRAIPHCPGMYALEKEREKEGGSSCRAVCATSVFSSPPSLGVVEETRGLEHREHRFEALHGRLYSLPAFCVRQRSFGWKTPPVSQWRLFSSACLIGFGQAHAGRSPWISAICHRKNLSLGFQQSMLCTRVLAQDPPKYF